MRAYTVQPGDTPGLIALKLTGGDASIARVNELVRQNPGKPATVTGRSLMFTDLTVGEVLALPPAWKLTHQRGLSGLGDLGACCDSCAHGGPCACGTGQNPTEPHARMGQIKPRNTGLGQAPSAFQTWSYPIGIGLGSIALGVGLAYVITHYRR